MLLVWISYFSLSHPIPGDTVLSFVFFEFPVSGRCHFNELNCDFVYGEEDMSFNSSNVIF